VEQALTSDFLRLALGAHAFELEGSGNAGWRLDEVVALSPHGPRVRVKVKIVPIAETAYDVCRSVGLQCDELVEALRVRPLVRVEVNKGGVGLGFVVQLEGGLRAVVKPQQMSPHSIPRYEVAAFRLAHALGLTTVPPAVLRTVTKDELIARLPPDLDFLVLRITSESVFNDGKTVAAVMAWAPDTAVADVASLEAFRKRVQWLSVGGVLPDGVRGLAAELSSMVLFDVLINNGDRMTGGNVLASADGLSTVWIDHGFAFGVAPHPRAYAHFQRCHRFSRRLIAALRPLDRAAVRRALDTEGRLLDDAEISALLERKEYALAKVDELVAAHGRDDVLPFE
jgi:hypothetical protein